MLIAGAEPTGDEPDGAAGRTGELAAVTVEAARTGAEAVAMAEDATGSVEAASEEAALAAASGVSAGKVCKGGGGSTDTGSVSGRIQAATAKAATNKAAMAPKGVLFFCSGVLPDDGLDSERAPAAVAVSVTGTGTGGSPGTSLSAVTTTLLDTAVSSATSALLVTGSDAGTPNTSSGVSPKMPPTFFADVNFTDSL